MKDTSIQHESFLDLYNKDHQIFMKLFNGVGAISTLTNRINKLSEDFALHDYVDAAKMKGDLFEIFAEVFFKTLSSDNRISVYDYKPVPSSGDYGVDGTGIGMDNKPLTVQVKFRSGYKNDLFSDDLNQFPFQSIVGYNVDKDTTTNMVVFTNAQGLHWRTDTRVFLGRIRCIGNKEIKELTGNGNTTFWKNIQDLISNTITLKYSSKHTTIPV
jgi:hypothetical protein